MKLTKLFKKYIVNQSLDSNNEDKFLKTTLAKYILDTESKFNLSKKEIAKRLKIPLDKLLLIENADLSIDLEDYSNVYADAIAIGVNKAIDEANRNTVVK